MNAPRILYVDSGKTFGGAEQITLALASAFAAAGAVTACVHLPGADQLRQELDRRGIGRYEAPEADRLTRQTPLTAVVRSFRPDIVHIHRTWPLSDRYATPAARRAGVSKVITTEHIRFEKCGARDRIAKRFLARFDSKIVAVSRAVAISLARYWRVDPDRVKVIDNGIDTDRFRPAASGSGQRTGLFPDRCSHRITAIGRLEEQKGFDLLIDAFALVRGKFTDPFLVIAGEGGLRPELEKRVRDAGVEDAVRFAGPVPDVLPLLRETDLFVLSSRWEGLPLTVLEAMAAGAPLVATAVDGTAEAVRDGEEGLVVPVDDIPALAAAMSAVLGDREAAAGRAAAARARVEERYSLRRMVDDYRMVYES